MDIRAVVVARRRPGDVDPVTPVGGVPMVARAVRALLAGAPVDHVVVLAPADRRAAVDRACSGLPVEVREASPLRAHAGRRATPAAGDGRPGGSGILLVHDAARPLTPPALVATVVTAVVTAADGCDAVVPVLPLADTVKLVDAGGLVTATPDRAGLRVLQTPHAVRSDLAQSDPDPLGLAVRGSVRAVAGDPLAFPVRTAWDLELAELLVGGAER